MLIIERKFDGMLVYTIDKSDLFSTDESVSKLSL